MSKGLRIGLVLAVISLLGGTGLVIAKQCCGTCKRPALTAASATAACSVAKAENCAGGGCGPGAAAKAAKIEAEPPALIGTATLKILLRADAGTVLLDARTGRYDDGKRIPGAQPLYAGSTAQEVERLIPDKNQLVVTYCSNVQCPASSQLARHLRTLGYENVLEYPAGIQGWIEAGNSVETVEKI